MAPLLEAGSEKAPVIVFAPVVVCSLVPELACSCAGVSSCLSEAAPPVPELESGVAKVPVGMASKRVLDAAAAVPADAHITGISACYLPNGLRTHVTKHDDVTVGTLGDGHVSEQ